MIDHLQAWNAISTTSVPYDLLWLAFVKSDNRAARTEKEGMNPNNSREAHLWTFVVGWEATSYQWGNPGSVLPVVLDATS